MEKAPIDRKKMAVEKAGKRMCFRLLGDMDEIELVKLVDVQNMSVGQYHPRTKTIEQLDSSVLG